MCIAQLQAESSQTARQSSQPANTEDEVWISPNDPTHGGAPDFWDMFQPGADWAQAEHHVRVVGIAQNLVTNGPADKLKVFYAFLKANHIKLAVGIGMLTWSDQCGKHIEGYVPPGGSRYVADRIKSLGGELSYIDVDEALWFGRYFGGTGACHSAIGTLATDVAANFKAYQAVFPDVRIGDTEPLGPPPSGDPTGQWVKNTQAWLDALQAATGQRLAFIHEDITDWSRPLPGYLPAVAKLAHSNHIPFAPIIIAASGKGPDETWMRSAEQNIDLLRKSGAWPPDHLMFSTWHVYPTHNLPESSPETFTHLIDYYFQTR
ncbi:hypothetical protein [Tunturiibacter gelidoferens]|uniref:Uncharacterized protein n=1 Tax=Tunturiibacter gelidiferens TaxID=3069689 RepID=A0ACC5P3F7_9BACT|nr:hypothetical protein [Edaphobacter lichenicola]MBB5341382.1 hypothetical protein [Edaphobacter lichenicola]